jgi:hypothetical protein
VIDVGAALTDLARDGYARIGAALEGPELDALRARCDDLMLGRVVHDGMFFQLDAASGAYEDLEKGLGWQGPSLGYRKIEKLELDPLFFAYLSNPVFARIATSLAPTISLYRAVLFSKAANGGTPLPWHQDAGLPWGIDRLPLVQIWTALDDAPLEAGCLEVIPASHRDGLATAVGGVIPADRARAAEADERALPLEARAGEAILLHNLTWHRSGRNRTAHMRRAFTVCFLDGRTACTRRRKPKRRFLPLFEG